MLLNIRQRSESDIIKTGSVQEEGDWRISAIRSVLATRSMSVDGDVNEWRSADT